MSFTKSNMWTLTVYARVLDEHHARAPGFRQRVVCRQAETAVVHPGTPATRHKCVLCFVLTRRGNTYKIRDMWEATRKQIMSLSKKLETNYTAHWEGYNNSE